MKFIIRLDDACPGMDHSKWESIESTLDKYGIKPIVAVIPDDKYFSTKNYTEAFWNKIRAWRDKGWEIALHGLTHLVKEIDKRDTKYIFFAVKSEFSGMGLEQQGALFKKSLDIFKDQGIEPSIFVAPNHGFDSVTLNALKMYTSISVVSDGIALHPYKESGFTFIPQLDWKLKSSYRGTRTICLHPSTMSEKDIRKFERDLEKNGSNATTVKHVLNASIPEKNLMNQIFAFLYRIYFRSKNFIYDTISRWNLKHFKSKKCLTK